MRNRAATKLARSAPDLQFSTAGCSVRSKNSLAVRALSREVKQSGKGATGRSCSRGHSRGLGLRSAAPQRRASQAWKQQFADEARAWGISAASVAALTATTYATATIAADRGQRSFRLSLDQFIAKRGGSAIVARGRTLKRLGRTRLSEHGNGFGRQRGNQHTLSAGATLAYDCRRSAFFTEQLYAALALIDRGTLSAGMRGSMHGEIGQTQFLPKSILNYGTGGNLDNAADALASTANFLRAHGWRAGAGYQPGEANFRAIQAWNAASVYQRAIALMGQRIDGREGMSARR
jgi:membrane-bound lytic murein transglycosylase B